MTMVATTLLSTLLGYAPPSDCKIVTSPPTIGTTFRCTSTFPSLGRRTYSVYLPKGFEKGQRLPVLVFLQTGEPYVNGLFKNLGVYPTLDKLFGDSAVNKFVFASPDQVMPSEPESSRVYYVTGTTGKFAKWHKFVTKEFPSLVWKRVMGNVGEQPERMAIDGISLGGYNAIQYALSNPTVFRAAACMSAAFYGPGVGFANKKLQMQNRYSDAELAAIKARVDAGSLKLRIQTSDAKDPRGKPLDSGPSTREVSARWIAAGLAHDVILDGPATSPPGVYWQGGHKVAYWKTILESRFRWHAIELGSISSP
ncbi:MAG: hypothetical protein HYY84_03435 [Deltaproteobacteria bacterium]|nr:hypothetical protein [Deltaproteobacteria bacterium]